MADISTTCAGLSLQSPIIVGSSGLSRDINNIKLCEEAGAGAVVLKSLFEEQVLADAEGLAFDTHALQWHPEVLDLINRMSADYGVRQYLSLIEQCKKEIRVPVIASLNCTSAGTWPGFARRIESAGADAIELNIFILPSGMTLNPGDSQKAHFEIVAAVLENTSVPVMVKIGPYFCNLARFIVDLSSSGVGGIVLFNRAFCPDIDIQEIRMDLKPTYSLPGEMTLPLRWISLVSDSAECDLVAGSGIHDADTVIKQILAGARAVQIVSALYQKGIDHIATLNTGIREWMERHGFDSLDGFRGSMSCRTSEDACIFERAQYIKALVGIE